MIKSKKALLILLFLPIFALILLAEYKKYLLFVGKEVTLPITGYDPRDLLSGHYLVYSVDYGVESICGTKPYEKKKDGFICLSPKFFSTSSPENCEILIKGVCNYSRFEAGVERYYVPESEAKRLEELVQKNQASIVLSVSYSGEAQIKDLLINGKSWRQHLSSAR